MIVSRFLFTSFFLFKAGPKQWILNSIVYNLSVDIYIVCGSFLKNNAGTGMNYFVMGTHKGPVNISL